MKTAQTMSATTIPYTSRVLKEHRDSRLLEDESRILEGRLADDEAQRWLRGIVDGSARSPSFEFDITARDKREARAQLEQRDLSVGTTTAGGFTVPSRMVESLVESQLLASGVRRAAQVFTTSHGGPLAVPVATGATTASIVAEGGLIGESDPTFAQVALASYKYALLIDASNELLADAEADLAAYIGREAGRAIGAGVGNHFANGTGSGQPLGVVHASSPYTVSTAPTGNVTAFSAAAISQFAKALPAAYRPRATWIMNPDDYVSLAALGTFPSLHDPVPSMFGSPVLIDAALPAPAASAKSLVYGSMQQAYVIRELARVQFAESAGQAFANDQTRFRIQMRLDGRPALAAAAIIGQHSAT